MDTLTDKQFILILVVMGCMTAIIISIIAGVTIAAVYSYLYPDDGCDCDDDE